MRIGIFLVAFLGLVVSASAESDVLAGCRAALEYSESRKGLELIVLQNGKVRCSSPDISTPHELWSGTKSIVGLMAATAVQDKLLSLDEKAADTLSEWQTDPEKSQITLRQLLSMTGGQSSTVGKPEGYLPSINAQLTSQPGTKFQYGPAPMQIFGEIMRRKLLAAGHQETPGDYVKRRLFHPIGIDIGGWRDGPDGMELMPQGLSLSATQWAKLGEFVRAGGQVRGKLLVDEAAFSQIFQGSAANPAYGLTWWLPRQTSANDAVTQSTDITSHAAELPTDMVVAAGAGNQRLYVIPSKGLTIVRLAKLDFAQALAGKPSNWSDFDFLNLLLDR